MLRILLLAAEYPYPTAAKFHYSNLFGWIKSNKGGIDGYTTIMRITSVARSVSTNHHRPA